MKYILAFVVVCLISNHTFAQKINNTEAALYNIGLGGFGAGIGAIINKKPEEKTGKVFLKGFWQGSLGGALVFGSKKITSEIAIQEQLEYNWPAKFVNAAGISIIENASSNRDFWEKWHINIGFNRFEFHTKDKFRFQYKVMPISLALTLGTAINSTPEWELMLRTGEIIFSTNANNLPNSNGLALGNVIRLREEAVNNFSTINHEIIHIYQYYDYNFINSYFNEPRQNWSDNSKTFQQLDKWFHWDLNGPLLRGLYLIEDANINCKFDNFFEFEAESYSNPTVICPD